MRSIGGRRQLSLGGHVVRSIDGRRQLSLASCGRLMVDDSFRLASCAADWYGRFRLATQLWRSCFPQILEQCVALSLSTPVCEGSCRLGEKRRSNNHPGQ